jgi:hypothetical protein
MKVVDIADELFNELGSPTSLSIQAISYWLRSNIGSLSNYLNEDFTLNASNLDIEKTVNDEKVQIDEDEKDILKKMYHIHYYDILLRSTLSAAGTDSVVEIQSDDTRVRRINKNELSKTYISLKRLEQDELSKLVNGYKIKKSSPVQIAGDDTVKGQYPHVNYVTDLNRTNN